MKNKISAIIISIAVIVNMFVCVMPAQAALGINNETAVSLMSALDIVPGYPDNYDANALVSQNDFIRYAYAASGREIDDTSAIASSYGFGGEGNITFSQALQVMLDVTDYSVIANSYGSAYDYASKAGILSNVRNRSKGGIVTTEAAAVMLYNLVNMKAVEVSGKDHSLSDETIMEKELKVYDGKGIVTATNETGLSGYTRVSDSCVMIDNIEYNIGKTYAQQLLGMYVKFYYKDDTKTGEYVLKWIEVNYSKTSTAVIYGCDVNSANSDQISYNAQEGGRRTAKLDRGADIIYNGSRSDSITTEAVNSLTCEVTLIDNDGNGSYNVVVIRDYIYYFVSAFSSSELIVNDYESSQTLDLDENHYSVLQVYKNGAAASVSDIVTGQVLAVTLSEDERIITVEILTGSVTGEITAYTEEDIWVAGDIYDISPAYYGDTLKIGRSGTFYFDRLGKIVRSQNMKTQASKYGYLMAYYSNGDGESNFEARILTAEGTVAVFKVNDSIAFNDSKKRAKEVYNLLNAANNCQQLITYTVNSENKITKINTANSNYIGVDEENIDEFTLNYEGTGKYRKNNMCFNSKYLIDSTTPIFLIPYDGERDEYAVKNASYLTNNYIYNISVYDIDEYMYGSAIVLRENLIEPENLRNKRALVITKITYGVNEDNEQVLILNGFQQGSKVSLTLADDKIFDNRGRVPVSSLHAGDVVLYGTNSKDEVNAVQIMYRASEKALSIAAGTTTPDTYWEGGTVVFPDLWASCGNVVNRNSTLIMVDDDGDETRVSKSPHLLGTATTYLYENNNVAVSNKNEIMSGDMVYVQEYQGKVQDVLIVRE